MDISPSIDVIGFDKVENYTVRREFSAKKWLKFGTGFLILTNAINIAIRLN